MIVTVLPMTPSHPGFGQVAALFEEYRDQYGQPPSPAATQAWLLEQMVLQRMSVAAAADDRNHVCGFITTTIVPGSLMLGTVWSVRDLYVAPRYRHAGIARQLLEYTINHARAAGALRVSLQTETDNAPALALYTTAGFRPVDGLTLLNLTLSPNEMT
ncbi:GNAT family N-acetyltransferase [Krasilnikovia sp. MM14-A1259]|uniref:GNAT family N-acetyltransferase n=1 Tax=Krasilnikovia sp. MM14-A1259 TaxID=3373539 RepID=UPI003801FEA1